MRSDLAKFPGVSEIDTDVPSRICKFKLDGDGDVQAAVEKLASTNKHMDGWSIVE